MKVGPLLALFLCAALVGWFAPDMPSDGVTKLSAQNGHIPEAGDVNLAVSRNDGWLAGETVLSRDSDGHFYADAMVEGHRYRFLVDTGASIVALTGADADSMGLYWDDDSLRPIGRGASGTVFGVPVEIEIMEVGGFEVRNVQAAIIPEGLDISLLGQSFLSQIENVKISGDEMKLGG